ncbi:MAG: hypothetical protein HYR98_00385 [Nitrospirae bacterium]|nr:hypothetical protein [Nitrospirota bacterium]MBI3392851.1 hypothetical protein [Nitrospirota bacterium]
MEKKAPTIPFHSAHSAPPMAAHQMAGPCALAMALGALGWDLTAQDIWSEVKTAGEDREPAYTTLSRLTLFAQKHGFEASLVQAGLDPVQWAITKGAQVIAFARTHEQLWATGAKLIIKVDEVTVTFHDPLHGPNRTMPRDEFEKLLVPYGRHPGHCYIIVSAKASPPSFNLWEMAAFANPQLACPNCSVVSPVTTYTCEECRQSFRYGPGLPLGCPNPRCPSGYWSFVRCANCDEEITLI